MIRLAVRVRAETAELALAELLEFAPAGVEETELGGGVVEYAIYGASGELPALPDLEVAIGGSLVELSSREIADDWSERWRRFHHAQLVGGRVWVRPPWEQPRAGTIDVCIEPGQAFGTGTHPTTRMCLELLLELAPAPGGLLDVGCGSGVLAIAAAKLGFEPVVAVDHEQASVAAAHANAAANGVGVEIRRLDLRRDALPPAPVVVANLLSPLLFELCERFEHQPRALVVGGLLAAQVDAVAAAFAARHGLAEQRRCAEGDWAAARLGSLP